MYCFLNQINYVLCYYNYSLMISSSHNDAHSPSPQMSHYQNDPGMRTTFLKLLFYVLCYSNYSLIIFPYHNESRSPSAQISLDHNDPGTCTAAQPKYTTF